MAAHAWPWPGMDSLGQPWQACFGMRRCSHGSAKVPTPVQVERCVFVISTGLGWTDFEAVNDCLEANCTPLHGPPWPALAGHGRKFWAVAEINRPQLLFEKVAETH